MKTSTAKLLAGALLVLPVAALAHTGPGAHGFVDGLIHPFLGMGQLVAVLGGGLLLSSVL